MCLLCIIIIINGVMLYIMLFELHNFSNLFSSFKENINSDITNFNTFLQVIPDLKEVVTIILNLCNSQPIHPFCNNQTHALIK